MSAVQDYEAVIGLEVHCQLTTAAKVFSPEAAVYGSEPNTQVDPVSLGHPGTLPVLNERAVEYTILMGLATNCSIRPRSQFARKHYFYPDLPKGYQISQYEDPICFGGWLDIDTDEGVRRIGITRIHIEEDAGKSIHDLDPSRTLLDYNRCGVPLIEIVSEPDIRTPAEASQYLQRIRQTVRYLGICDGNMEEGSLRCDANISIRPTGTTDFGTKTEVKNMNSFRNVERALEYEISRQEGILRQGDQVVQETLLWDAEAMVTRSMRSKEEAHDYRYFPDPDLVPMVVTQETLETLRDRLPEMPEQRRARLVGELGLPAYDAAVLTEERPMADYFDDVVAALLQAGAGVAEEIAKPVSNVLMTDVLRTLKERNLTVSEFPIDARRMAGLIVLRIDDRISSTGATTLYETMLENPKDAESLARELDLVQVSDEAALLPLVKTVIEKNPGQVDQYLAGKTGLLGFFIGQVMRQFSGAADPKVVRALLQRELAGMDEDGNA